MKNTKDVWQGIVEGTARSRQGLIILEEAGEKVYGPTELIAAAARAGACLLKSEVKAGDTVGILAQTTPSTVLALLGCWAAGVVPVPLPLPARMVDSRSFIEQSRRRLEKVRAKKLIAPGTLMPMLGDLGSGIRLMAAEELSAQDNLPSRPCRGEDVAMVQFTSGSTSEPRGVVLSHRAIMANARAIIKRMRITPRDRVLSWMPLYHDMGLIGFFISALSSGCTPILMPPQRFVADPSFWFRSISEYRATITGGPNFSYALSARVLKSGLAGHIDLSSLRLALNGAEPVDSLVLDELVKEGEPYGLKATAPYPVYGLAEATLAVTFPAIGQRYRVDRICRDAMEREARALPVGADAHGARSLVSVGTPLPGVQVLIIKDNGEPAGDRQIGEVCLRGPSLMQGYWEDESATAQALRDGWLHTGDLGYFAEGQLYLAGRIKDVVIVGGRNLFPQDVERCAERVSGIRKGNAVAFGVTSPRGRERLILVGETRLECPNKAFEAARAVLRMVREEIGVPVREVVLVPAGSLPKTSSGKKRRFLCRDLYFENKLQPVARSGAAINKS